MGKIFEVSPKQSPEEELQVLLAVENIHSGSVESIKRDLRGSDGASLLISFRLITDSSHEAL